MRAQITLFIIIGLLIVIAFGIALYIGNRVRQVETRAPVELGTQPIKDYITTCLSLATTEGLTLIGRQGGAIYQSQGGLTEPFDIAVKYTDNTGVYDIPYVILPPSGNVGELFFSEPPRYPFDGFPYPAGETEPLFNGYYGTSRLPPLYKKTPEGQPVAGSIQENLETYISRKTADCTDWKQFTDKGYSITPGTAAASLLFATQTEQFRGEQDITAQLTWPVEVTTPTGDKQLLTEFSIRQQVRLATIYYTVKRIVDSDVTNISYEPTSPDQFTVSILPYGEDSIVSIKDTQSSLANKPFEFLAPRQNRRPALWQIDTSPLDQITFHITPEGRGATITAQDNMLRIEDPCQEAGVQNPYIIELRATDPDENKIAFDVQIPGSSTNQLEEIGEYPIKIFATDQSSHSRTWFDSQEIQLQVAQCEVR